MNRRQFLATTSAASLAFSLQAASENKLRVAVIGHTGQGNYGHGLDTLWLKVPETVIVGVADADAKGLAEAQKRLSLDTGFADYREMLKELKPDIVSIGPRHIHEHLDMVLAAVEQGAKGIYMEKPFCRTLEEADKIVAACEKKNVKLSLAHRNRFHPVLPVVKKLIADGTIGHVLEFRGRGKEDARGGGLDLWVLGSHVLNLVHYFGGKPLACSAGVYQDGRLMTKADIKEGAEGIGLLAGNEIHARYELESGIPAFFDSIHDTSVKEAGFGLQIIGAKGIIDLRIDEEPLAHLLAGSPFDPVKTPRAWEPISTAGVGKPEPIKNLSAEVGAHITAAQDLLASIQENRQPLCNATEGLVTVEMIAAVFESQRLNGQRVTFPLATRTNPLAQF